MVSGGTCETDTPGAAGWCSAAGGIVHNDVYSCETTNNKQHGFCTGYCFKGPSNCQNSSPLGLSYCSQGYCSSYTNCQTSNPVGSSYCYYNTYDKYGNVTVNPGACTSPGVCQTLNSNNPGYCQGYDSSHKPIAGFCGGSISLCQTKDKTMPGYCTGTCMDYLGSSNPGCSTAGGSDAHLVQAYGAGLTSTGNTITDIGNCQTNAPSSAGYCAATCVNGGLPCTDTDVKDGYGNIIAAKNCNGTCLNGNGNCQTSNSVGKGYCDGHGTCGSNMMCSTVTINNGISYYQNTLMPSCQNINGASAHYCGTCTNNLLGIKVCTPGACKDYSSTAACQMLNSSAVGYCDGKCIYNSGAEQAKDSTGTSDNGKCQTSDSTKPYYCTPNNCSFSNPQINNPQTPTAPIVKNTGICSGLLINTQFYSEAQNGFLLMY